MDSIQILYISMNNQYTYLNIIIQYLSQNKSSFIIHSMSSLTKQTPNSPSPFIPTDYNLKQPYRTQLQKFQQKCGQCLKALQEYKLKTNFIGCNMDNQDFNKYYQYYTTKPKKRLSFARDKLDSLIRAYERNTIFVQALELKTINNMMKNYRTRQGLMTNQPTNYNYTRFQKDQSELIETILNNDCHKLPELQKLLAKIKSAQQGASQSMKQKLQKNSQTKKPNFIRALKVINKSEVRYYRYFQSFQRSIANMVNQIHAYIQKLNQFYTVWQNLGSSLIYELKSDREVLIDKTLEQRKSKNFSYCQQDQDQIIQVIDVLPLHSKMRKYYEERLQDFKKKGSRSYASNNTTSNTFSNNSNKNKKGNLKQGNQTITKVSWYETQAEDIKDYNFNDNNNMVLREREDGFFRYTYEQLHTETLQYMNEVRNKRIMNDFQGPAQQSYIDRFYVFCEKKERNKQQHYLNDFKITKYNVPTQMSFNCWFDRLGPKGAFNVQDFPVNLFQRKIQFEIDRQQQMSTIDEKRKRQYNNKQVKLDFMEEQGGYNIGYKYMDSTKELQDIRHYLSNQYDPEYLPEPKKIAQIQNNPKEKKNEQQHKDFSDSDQESGKEKKEKKKTEENEKFITSKMYKYQIQLNDDGELITVSEDPTKEQNQQEEQINVRNSQTKMEKRKKSEKLNDNQAPSINIKHSQDFLNKLQEYQDFKLKNNPQQNFIEKSKLLNKSAKQLKQEYPWFQLKKKAKQTLQLFAQNYLPEHQKSILNKFQKQIQRQGYTPQQLDPISYKYLPNCQIETLKKCINVQSQIQNINKVYLINNQFYVKIQPIYFTVNKKIIKIFIYLISQLKQFEKLKHNLQALLNKYGKCTFQFNVDWLSKNKSYEQKFYAMIGHIITSQKIDRSMNNLLTSNQEIQDDKLIEIGQKIYEPYEKYCLDLLKLAKEQVK